MFWGYIKGRHNLTISQGIISLLSRYEETTTRERILYEAKMKSKFLFYLTNFNYNLYVLRLNIEF